MWQGIAVWDKGNSRPTPEKYRNDCEYIVWGTNGKREAKAKAGCKVAPGCYRTKSVNSKEKHHQTEKPVELLEKLLFLAPEGGTVLDMWMGSGSTGVACANLGLNFVGIEISDVYYETAKRRLEEAGADIEEM